MIKRFKNKLSTDVHFSELFRGSSIAFFMHLVGLVLGYIFTILVARWYGAGTMGLYALSLTLLNIFVTISIFGFDSALVKFVADYNYNNKPSLTKEIYKKAITFVAPMSIIFSLLFYLFSDSLALNVFKNPLLVPYFHIAALIVFPSALLTINTAFLRGLKNIKLFAFLDKVALFFFTPLFLAILYYFLNLGGIATIISRAIALALLVIISFLTLRQYSYVFKSTIQKVLRYRTILRVSLPMLLTSSLVLVMSWTDIIMLGIFTDEKEVGVYNVVIKLAMLAAITMMAINTIAAPKFSEFYSRGDIQGLKRVARNSTRMVFFTSLPAILILIMFPTFILEFFGQEFIVGRDALLILMISQFINISSGPVGSLLNMTGKQVALNIVMLTASIFNIVLNYFLIPIYGMEGAAIATLISLFFNKVISLILIRVYYGFFMLL
jgi:O-antigen/teichoic acid export membrane protein